MGTASSGPTRFNAENSTPLKSAGYLSGSQVILAYKQNFELRNKPEFPTSYTNNAYTGDDELRNGQRTMETSWTITQPKVTCTVCSNEIDNLSRSFDGKNLPYLQTVCEECFKASGEQESTDTDLEMSDPEFCQDFALSADPNTDHLNDSDSDNLSDNFFTQSSLRSSKAGSKTSKRDEDLVDSSPLFDDKGNDTCGHKPTPVIICSACDEGNKARKQCNECGYICEECIDAHFKFRQLQRHIVTVVEELVPRTPAQSTQEFTTRHMCLKHPEFEVALFCASEKCKLPICAMCTLKDHDKLKGHVHVKLNDAMTEALDNIKKTSELLIQKKDKVLTSKASIVKARMSLAEQFKSRGEELQKIAKNLHQLIDQRYLSASTKLEQLHKTENRRLEDQQSLIQSIHEDIDNANDIAKESSKQDDPVEILETRDRLRECFMVMESQEVPGNNFARVSFQFTEDHHAAVCDIKQAIPALFDFYEIAPSPSSDVIKSASLVSDNTVPVKKPLNGNVAAMYEVDEGFNKMGQRQESRDNEEASPLVNTHAQNATSENNDARTMLAATEHHIKKHETLVHHQDHERSDHETKDDVTSLFDELHAELEQGEQALKEATTVRGEYTNSKDSYQENKSVPNTTKRSQISTIKEIRDVGDRNGAGKRNELGNNLTTELYATTKSKQNDKTHLGTNNSDDEDFSEISASALENVDARQREPHNAKSQNENEPKSNQITKGNFSTDHKTNDDKSVSKDYELRENDVITDGVSDYKPSNSKSQSSQDSKMTNENSPHEWDQHESYSPGHHLNGNIAAMYELNGNYYSDSNFIDENPPHDIHLYSQSANSSQSSQSSELSYDQDNEDEEDWNYQSPHMTGIAALYELNDDSLLKQDQHKSVRSRSRSRSRSRNHSNTRSHSNSCTHSNGRSHSNDSSRHSSIASDNIDADSSEWNPSDDLYQSRDVTIFHGLDDGFLLRERQSESPTVPRRSLSRNSSVRSLARSSSDANRPWSRSRSSSSSRSSAASFNGSMHSDFSQSSRNSAETRYRNGAHFQSNWSPISTRKSEYGRSITTCALSESPPKTYYGESLPKTSYYQADNQLNGKIDPLLCTVTLDRNLRLNKPSKTILRTYDAFGDPIRIANANIQVRLEYEDVGWHRADGQIILYDHVDGTYTIQFTPCWYGNHRMSVSVDGIPIQDSPFLFWVPYCM